MIITRGEEPCPFWSFHIKRFAAWHCTALDQDVKDETILTDGVSEPMFLADNHHHHLVEMPFATEPAS